MVDKTKEFKEAQACVESKEYEKALGLFKSLLSSVQTRQVTVEGYRWPDSLSQDISRYIDVLEKLYVPYEAGNRAREEGHYDDAIAAYEKARYAGDKHYQILYAARLELADMMKAGLGSQAVNYKDVAQGYRNVCGLLKDSVLSARAYDGLADMQCRGLGMSVDYQAAIKTYQSALKTSNLTKVLSERWQARVTALEILKNVGLDDCLNRIDAENEKLKPELKNTKVKAKLEAFSTTLKAYGVDFVEGNLPQDAFVDKTLTEIMSSRDLLKDDSWSILLAEMASAVFSIASLGTLNLATGRSFYGLFSDRAEAIARLDTIEKEFEAVKEEGVVDNKKELPQAEVRFFESGDGFPEASAPPAEDVEIPVAKRLDGNTKP